MDMDDATLPGLVVASHGRHYRVELADGRLVTCVPYGKKSEAVCGDRVRVRLSGPEQGAIAAIAPRDNLFYRADAFRQKLIAANVTQVVIVVAAVPSFYEELLVRCLVAAQAAGAKALIALNKCDLAESVRAEENLALYQQLGYRLVKLSAHRDVAPLRPFLEGETSVLVGQSGMGKSSIVNALLPAARARTNDVSAALDSGRHTTTHAQLYRLDAESQLIDSPGMQEFGLGHLSRQQVARAFVEFRPYLGQCRFSDCRHAHEPGCAIRAAVEGGEISPRRHALFLRIAPPDTPPRRRR
jgi:ribosome biogenesis GTPase